MTIRSAMRNRELALETLFMKDALALLTSMLTNFDLGAKTAPSDSFRVRSHQRRVASTAGIADEETWTQTERAYEKTVQTLTKRWGAALVTEKNASGPGDDFFAAAIEFPPDPASDATAAKSPEIRISILRAFGGAHRFHAWRLQGEVAYVALEHADNTRVVSLIVGVFKS